VFFKHKKNKTQERQRKRSTSKLYLFFVSRSLNLLSLQASKLASEAYSLLAGFLSVLCSTLIVLGCEAPGCTLNSLFAGSWTCTHLPFLFAKIMRACMRMLASCSNATSPSILFSIFANPGVFHKNSYPLLLLCNDMTRSRRKTKEVFV